MLTNLPDKDFFTMGEAARIAQVDAHTLRYWESRLKTLRPSRLPSGHRRYTRADLETILSIKDLVRRRKLTIDGARRALLEGRRGRACDPAAEGSAVDARVLKTLAEARKELRSLIEDLSR